VRKYQLALILTLSTFSSLGFAQALPVAGYIRKLKGKMIILNSKSEVIADTEGKKPRQVKENSPFHVGETLKTLANSRAKLEFLEGGAKGKNESVLGPDTTLVVTRAQTTAQASSGTELLLKDGEVRSNVKKAYSGKGSDQFLIRTPNAVAGVRGTVFSVFYDNLSKQSQFAVEVGQVLASVSGKSESVPLREGMFTGTTTDGGTLSSPKPISESPEIQKKVEGLKSEDPSVSQSGSPSGSQASGSSTTKKENANAPLMRKPEETSGRAPANAESAPLLPGTGRDRMPGAEAPPAFDSGSIKVEDIYRNLDSIRNEVNQNLSNSTFGKTSITVRLQ
jgi:hypothetical protein